MGSFEGLGFREGFRGLGGFKGSFQGLGFRVWGAAVEALHGAFNPITNREPSQQRDLSNSEERDVVEYGTLRTTRGYYF